MRSRLCNVSRAKLSSQLTWTGSISEGILYKFLGWWWNFTLFVDLESVQIWFFFFHFQSFVNSLLTVTGEVKEEMWFTIIFIILIIWFDFSIGKEIVVIPIFSWKCVALTMKDLLQLTLFSFRVPSVTRNIQTWNNILAAWLIIVDTNICALFNVWGFEFERQVSAIIVGQQIISYLTIFCDVIMQSVISKSHSSWFISVHHRSTHNIYFCQKNGSLNILLEESLCLRDCDEFILTCFMFISNIFDIPSHLSFEVIWAYNLMNMSKLIACMLCIESNLLN